MLAAEWNSNFLRKSSLTRRAAQLPLRAAPWLAGASLASRRASDTRIALTCVALTCVANLRGRSGNVGVFAAKELYFNNKEGM